MHTYYDNRALSSNLIYWANFWGNIESAPWKAITSLLIKIMLNLQLGCRTTSPCHTVVQMVRAGRSPSESLKGFCQCAVAGAKIIGVLPIFFFFLVCYPPLTIKRAPSSSSGNKARLWNHLTRQNINLIQVSWVQRIQSNRQIRNRSSDCNFTGTWCCIPPGAMTTLLTKILTFLFFSRQSFMYVYVCLIIVFLQKKLLPRWKGFHFVIGIALLTYELLYIYWSETPHLHLCHTLSLWPAFIPMLFYPCGFWYFEPTLPIHNFHPSGVLLCLCRRMRSLFLSYGHHRISFSLLDQLSISNSIRLSKQENHRSRPFSHIFWMSPAPGLP